jgi:adenosylhomocysteine nucleosidase
MPARPLVSVIGVFVALVVATAAWAQPIVGVLGITSEVVAVERQLVDSREVAVRGHIFRVGTLNGRRVAVGRCGAGKVNATIVATLLIDHFEPAAVFFSGTAGAIDQDLYPGDVVIGVAVAQHDIGVTTRAGIERRGLRNGVSGERDPILLPAPDGLLSAARAAATGLTLRPAPSGGGAGRSPRIIEGVIVTGDTFVSDVAMRDELRASLGAAAVEMEGAALVQTCRQFAVPCLVIRSITDRADGKASDSYEQFRPAASENAAALVAATIARLP